MIGFYVTVIRGSKVGWLLGPFSSKSEAEARVEETRHLANKLDPWTDFDAFGVTHVESTKLWKGKLNKDLGLTEEQKCET